MMPPKALDAAGKPPQKRKEPPQSSADRVKQKSKRVKVQNARTILTQTSDAALSHGELDIQAFLKAREFEIKALEDGMRRSKESLNTRAFQEVPQNMRRRAASHNVQRIPKRLQKRAGREMREDNTPTVTAKKRKPGSPRSRIRAETAKRLGILSQKKKDAKAKATAPDGSEFKRASEAVVGRAPRPKTKNRELSAPPKPLSKFKKRQIHKSWLPTHIYHAKRAKMTEPKKPLWRFSIPLTPTEKSYRPTHRAGNARGAVCWDMSYMATISLESSEASLEKVLRAVGISQDEAWSDSCKKWREGRRSWSGWLSRDESGKCKQIGPATVIWCHAAATNADEATKEDGKTLKSPKTPPRRLFVRVHPSAFLELWNEVLRLSKMQRPAVRVEDLRFEIGSIEMTGPSSTETLLGILHPYEQPSGIGGGGHINTFNALAGVTNAASLPPNALLTLSITDPRLRHPPRKAKIPKPGDDEAAFSLLETLAAWPADQSPPSASLFDSRVRLRAARLPSQKSINRRKGLAPPGEYPPLTAADEPIPVLLFTSRATSASGQGSWTLLAPWKCILPIWYCLMHYPLSSGGNPRFGGLQELQQMHFENRKPWFPADYPGTEAGWSWELDERQRRRGEWERRPKGKRIEFESLDLGNRRKGEVGLGWACGLEILRRSGSAEKVAEKGDLAVDGNENLGDEAKRTSPPFQHFPTATLNSVLSNPKLDIPQEVLVTVRITLFSRGVPQACARIYRLPPRQPPANDPQDSSLLLPSLSTSSPNHQASSTPSTQTKPVIMPTTTTPSLRDQWLALAPPKPASRASKPKPESRPGPLHVLPPPLRQRALAQSLLQPPPLRPALLNATLASSSPSHPVVPDADDLIGFVTTGAFNLAEGKGSAIGSVVVDRVFEGRRRRLGREDRMCIVRNAGESVGRLGIWEVV